MSRLRKAIARPSEAIKKLSPLTQTALAVGVALFLLTLCVGFFAFGGPAAREGYWIAYWAALLAGGFLSVSVFLAITRLVDTWHSQADSDARMRAVALACGALADDLRLFLSQSNNFALRKPEQTIPAYVQRMERLLEDKSLSDWIQHASEKDRHFLGLVMTFRQCYAYFLAACDEVKIDLPDAFVEWNLTYR